MIPGIETSEFKLANEAGWFSVLVSIFGFMVTIIDAVMSSGVLGAGTVAGAVLVAVGAALKAFVSSKYTESRAQVKAADSYSKAVPTAAQE